jgi:hypothetical protein
VMRTAAISASNSPRETAFQPLFISSCSGVCNWQQLTLYRSNIDLPVAQKADRLIATAERNKAAVPTGIKEVAAEPTATASAAQHTPLDGSLATRPRHYLLHKRGTRQRRKTPVEKRPRSWLLAFNGTNCGAVRQSLDMSPTAMDYRLAVSVASTTPECVRLRTAIMRHTGSSAGCSASRCRALAAAARTPLAVRNTVPLVAMQAPRPAQVKGQPSHQAPGAVPRRVGLLCALGENSAASFSSHMARSGSSVR